LLLLGWYLSRATFGLCLCRPSLPLLRLRLRLRLRLSASLGLLFLDLLLLPPCHVPLLALRLLLANGLRCLTGGLRLARPLLRLLLALRRWGLCR
jgi:hypothetical protein